ncbi:hypothetical protein F5X99DRAFT_411428 [Biscogniauxia marginata]|nr:hypothetical protein F5X99DRAFT_411428 [Biscogniauxia marginata]
MALNRVCSLVLSVTKSSISEVTCIREFLCNNRNCLAGPDQQDPAAEESNNIAIEMQPLRGGSIPEPYVPRAPMPRVFRNEYLGNGRWGWIEVKGIEREFEGVGIAIEIQ